MCLRKHQNSPLEKSWQSALFAVSYVFKYYTPIISVVIRQHLEDSHLKLNINISKIFFSQVRNKYRYIYLDCGVTLDCKLYLSNHFWEWDTGFAIWMERLLPLNLTVLFMQPINPQKPRVVNMTEKEFWKKSPTSSVAKKSRETGSVSRQTLFVVSYNIKCKSSKALGCRLSLDKAKI